LEDGTLAVKGAGEIFEKGDLIELKDELKEIPIEIYDDKKLEIIYDYNFRNPEDQKIINEIAALLKSEPKEELKKSLDPISIITIGGAFVLREFAAGFLNKMGADAWDKLKNLMKKKKKSEKLLRFDFTIRLSKDIINVSTILTNPTSLDMESFLKYGLPQLEKMLPKYFAPEIGLKKIIVEFSNNDVKILFGIRKDAVPLFIHKDLKSLKG